MTAPASARTSVLVLDYGSQYTQLIARRIRELNVYCEIYPWHKADEALRKLDTAAIVLSGGPNTVRSAEAPSISDAVLESGLPLLGICYGMQLLAQRLGGRVEVARAGEYGHARVSLKSCPLFAGIDARQLDVWMSHGDAVQTPPDGFRSYAHTDNTPVAAMGDTERRWYGLQFHPEVRHTHSGMDILRNFVKHIAGCTDNWVLGDVATELVEKLREQVGEERVLLGLSGGVDSAVAAVLLHKAIGKRLVCLFIDNGLLRLNEAEQVRENFASGIGLELLCVDASQQFISALEGVSDPEEKRRVIGRVFVEVFEERARALTNVPFLAQGTIYSDVIESAAGTDAAHLIKSHHNVGGLPKRMNMRLVEPLRALFKDEVRRLARTLGVPSKLVDRHPFPGPGLGVRCLGEINAQALEQLRQADHIFIEELRKAGWYDQLSQAFAVFLPVSSVGVAGDARVYAPVIALRAVQTDDFMTAHWARLPQDLLATVSARIVNELSGISRVVYDISDKPPATIEWE